MFTVDVKQQQQKKNSVVLIHTGDETYLLTLGMPERGRIVLMKTNSVCKFSNIFYSQDTWNRWQTVLIKPRRPIMCHISTQIQFFCSSERRSGPNQLHRRHDVAKIQPSLCNRAV